MQSKMALITFMDGDGSRPDNSLPGGLPPGAVNLPVFPFDPTIDNSLPGGSGRPDQGLPGSQPGIDNTLPGSPTYPSQGLPGGGHVSGQPIVPGRKFVVKWLACVGLILVPDNTLPPTAEPKA
jgi:hypothetical protein